ncbi:hypothetical protein [Kiritimatiella glycovorans]|uniref:Uncharacterized protein n=1 Tax=Kiritimatiella glycovorans TaxID=1307763 RepID=A0A0G3EFZ7_9BACT|nr:hypothetical protein [Kiritimatiella glycovorans]AKJ65351.1 hypothetical protein L21SP4_02120 [Kiritimatiella glycovorans]
MAGDTAYSIRKRAPQCAACERPFEDGDTVDTRLFRGAEGYERRDYCPQCAPAPDASDPFSHWKTVFHPPPPPEPEPVRRESAESLLRRLIEEEEAGAEAAIFVLAIMLERKKLLVEKAVREEEGRKLRCYEHRKTGESFVVEDPELRLAELEHVQEDVVRRLEGDGERGEQGQSRESVKPET